MRKYVTLFIIICFFIPTPLSKGYAASPSGLVSKGNSAFLAGNYDEALSAYDEASVEMPESPHIYYNKGAALYKKGDYAKAMEMFQKAALKARDIKLEAKAKFNLGNCSFREAERQKDSDMHRAMQAYNKSILFYQEALQLAPDFKEAAENIEIVRLVMKSILDEMQRHKEDAKKRQQAADRIEELIEKQQELLNRGRYLSEEKQAASDRNEKVADLADDQDALRRDTQDLAKSIPTSKQKRPPPSPSHLAGKHLENAAGEQGLASEKIRQNQTKPALANQQKAVDELKKALESLSGDKNKDGRQDRQKQPGAPKEGREKDQQKKAQSAGNKQERDDGNRAEKTQSAMARLPDDAQSILDEEKENMKHRNLPYSGGYREVEKDW